MLFMYLSGYYNIKLYQRQSLIIFDEVQLCPKARAAIKYLVVDGRYNYTETGSLISAAIYDAASVIYDKYISPQPSIKVTENSVDITFYYSTIFCTIYST